MTEHTAVKTRFDADNGVATFTLAMAGRANKINAAFGEGFLAAVDWAEAQDGLKGIILETAHRDFCVGADLDMLFGERDPARIFEACSGLSGLFRRLETLGVPVVAELTGSALGGGYELALACHRRIALNEARIQVGLPEVALGVIPGAGGTQRLPRMIGIQKALEQILAGAMVRAPKALKLGMVDELVEDKDAMREAALAWIAANPRAKQPWDEKSFKWPGPAPDSEDAINLFVGAYAMLFKKTAGAIPSPEVALKTVRQGSFLTMDRALELEAREFAAIAVSPGAKDMIRTFWYHRTAAERCEGLPTTESMNISKVGVLGAGMMGAGLAYVSAAKGLEVVVKDISQEALDGGQAHCKAEAAKKRHLSQEARDTILNRITWTLDLAPLEGCDLVIEAVVENDKVKAVVTREVEPLLAEGGIFASNTSAIPITHLAQASEQRERFIGLHFFSPVEKMPLLEIIMGEATNDETLARCLAFGRLIGKTPIVVNDGYGFYTSRVFGSYLMEAVQLVAEGHDPVLVEWAARERGMVVPPLKVFDEVTLTLGRKGLTQREAYLGESVDGPGIDLLKAMVDDHDRGGKAAGGGFYDYEGKKRTIWPGLKALVSPTPEVTGTPLIGDRLMYAQIAEVGRVLDDGILRKNRDAEVGAIFGIGFAPGSGGPLAWMDRRGLDTVVADLRRLAEAYGERFEPAQTLVTMADRGQRFFDK
ncbi:MAG: 3-hydroxyacyl-CoA dehydrogenase NAD-binding domain-containing protein [Myxococcota bacterium]